jgi:coenzyme PQQ precursor peptide PqqA
MTPFTTLPAGPHGPDAQPEELLMKWHTPKMVEIACGCEINAYFPAHY